MARLAIIGGGASGLIAACVAAELSHAYARDRSKDSPLDIVIYEATDKIGRPILRSGNGRCNLTNSAIDASIYRNSQFVSQVLTAASSLRVPLHLDDPAFQYPQNIVACYFEQHGVALREEAQGRIYPLTNKASTVLDALKFVIARFDVRVELDSQIVSIDEPTSDAGPITLRGADGEFIRVDQVIDATGGTQSKGVLLPFVDHIEGMPTLGPIATDNKLIKRLDSIRVRGEVSLASKDGTIKVKERGEVMFRKYGLSGIAVFNISRFMEPGDVVMLDFLPQIPRGDIGEYLRVRSRRLESCTFGRPTNFDMLNGLVLPDVADALLKFAHLDDKAPCSPADFDALADALKSFMIECKGIGDAALCQVVRGGYLLEGINAATMSAKRSSRIHMTGESLDVDAPCGGYNLHWAFATGMLAAYDALMQITKAG